MKKIKLIIGSTRQGRVGKPIANWLVAQAKEAGVELGVLDLQEIGLPFFDAAAPPAYMPTQTPEGKAWQQMIADSDGFVFLTPEYNQSIPASLKNAIDYLLGEWEGKSAAIVSYGYATGGASAASHLKDIIGNVKLSVTDTPTAIQFGRDTFDEKGAFNDIDAALMGSKESFLMSLKTVNAA